MRLAKRLRKHPIVTGLLSFLFVAYLWLIFTTSRVEIVNRRVLDDLKERGIPGIGVFWHGRMLFMPHVLARGFPTPSMLISNHPDGELIARIIRAFGAESIRGGTGRGRDGEQKPRDKGGAQALRALLRALKSGYSVGITPDGPRGPRMRLQPGVVKLAQMSGAPIVLASWSGSFVKVFDSWDRFMLPFPFGRVVTVIGVPIYLPTNLDDDSAERTRQALERALNDLTQECDRRIGRAIVEPAPPRTQPVLRSS